jgi:hypothetical protein
MPLLDLEVKASTIWSSLTEQEKMVYESINAKKYIPPTLHKKSPTTFDNVGEPDDWSKPKAPASNKLNTYTSYKTPLEKKAYLTGHTDFKIKPDKDANEAKINSREDYHKASAAFHRGRFEQLNNKNYSADHPMTKQKQFHEKLADMHYAAPGLLKYNKPKYDSHLKNIQSGYAAMEGHAKANKFPIGTGHTRYVTKS